MAIILRALVALILIISLSGCNADENIADADEIRQTAISRLQAGKTYMLMDGFDDAIAYYKAKNDTTNLLETYQLAAIKMKWKGEQDSAALYLQEALIFAGKNTSPSKGDIYNDLAALYSRPLLDKDYHKAIEFSHKAASEEPGGYNARMLHDIGIFYAFLNENDSAKTYLERAIKETPAGSPYYSTFALNYAGLSVQDFDKSISYLDSIESGHLGMLISKGFLYLNHGQLDSANSYLRQSQVLYDNSPETYSINTYNNLRLLSNCVSYATTGKVYPGEGTEVNDSISERMSLNRRINAEITEHNSRLEIELLESANRMQRIWIGILVLALCLSFLGGWLFWKNKRNLLNLHKELEILRRNQIIIEAEDNEAEDSRSFEIIAKRAEMCINRFRETGLLETIQKGESCYNDNNSYLSIKERTEIRQALLECFADFIIDLKMDAGRLAMDDIITAVLSVMRASNSAIAACMGVSAGAIRTRKTRLKGKLLKVMSDFVFA
ncbi:MAG: hypothetical protein K2J82_07895 [Muribaculaceae bacterium]|nr:hypothetical protein [Muribaculaceae bacterium]